MTNAAHAAAHFDRLRAARPLVHNITNYVAMDISANALLALGASPAMIHAPEEAGEFAGLASALVLNIGTLSKEWVEGMMNAADAAEAKGTPIVLDPVGAGATAYRTEVARALVAKSTVVRGNASEILALAGDAAGPTRGVDATDPVEAALQGARALAKNHGVVVAVTGEVDLVTDGERTLRVRGGSPLMAQVTAMGCSATAAVGAFLGTPGEPPLAGTAHALLAFGLAGTEAAKVSQGPGSFRVAFMDALAALTPERIAEAPEIEA
ncbi:MAG: hydroxyethylthiazole kinase [Myxococcota bacterium]